MFTYLNEFLHRYNYPTKSKDELMDTYQQLQQTAKYSLFQDYVKAYQQDAVSSFKEIINGLQKIAEEENLKEYSLNLLYLILISKHLNEIYEDLQWSEEMYDEAMFDLKYSMIECYRVYRIWGNFKMEWELRFFALKRVALGRLQQPEEVLWRIFGHDWKAKPKALPRGTTLQKAYAEWLLKGTQMKKGTGVFFYTGDV